MSIGLVDWRLKSGWMRDQGITAATWDSDGRLLSATLDPKHQPHDESKQTDQPPPPPGQPSAISVEERRRIAMGAGGRPVKLVGADG